MTDKKLRDDIAQKVKQFREYTKKFLEDVEKLGTKLKLKQVDKKKLKETKKSKKP